MAALLLSACCFFVAHAQRTLPLTDTTALDGHKVLLPRDLSTVTVVIVGFTRASADATTAWEVPVRTRLAGGPVAFYDVAVLASVPGFLHGWVLHSLKSKVPPVLQAHFLPVFADESAWKAACSYDPNALDAACVLLVDRSGQIQWQTHQPYTSAQLEHLRGVIEHLVAMPN